MRANKAQKANFCLSIGIIRVLRYCAIVRAFQRRKKLDRRNNRLKAEQGRSDFESFLFGRSIKLGLLSAYTDFYFFTREK